MNAMQNAAIQKKLTNILLFSFFAISMTLFILEVDINTELDRLWFAFLPEYRFTRLLDT